MKRRLPDPFRDLPNHELIEHCKQLKGDVMLTTRQAAFFISAVKEPGCCARRVQQMQRELPRAHKMRNRGNKRIPRWSVADLQRAWSMWAMLGGNGLVRI